MTYGQIGFALLCLSFALVLPVIGCLIGACIPSKSGVRSAFAIATLALSALAVGAYWLAWSILAGI